MGIIGPRSGRQLEWRLLQPEFAGLRHGMAEILDRNVTAGHYPGLHSLLIIRRNHLVLERYYGGTDENWGKPLGVVQHTADTLHDVRSITKSVVGLLYGIALSERKVPPTTAPVMSRFPRYPNAALRKIRISHALSMTMGLAWHEDFSYTDPTNGEREMEASPDRYRYILSREVVGLPGKTWTYCGGATALLGHLIAEGTGSRLEDYAKAKLFDPLDIAQFEWVSGSDGEAAASSGLRLRPRDLAKVGQLILDRGEWNGRQIVPRDWLSLSFKPRAHVEKGIGYGYQWWLGWLIADGKPWYGAFGNGGQRLIVIPSLDMAVVIMSGNYNREDQGTMPMKLMSKFVIASVAKSLSSRRKPA